MMKKLKTKKLIVILLSFVLAFSHVISVFAAVNNLNIKCDNQTIDINGTVNLKPNVTFNGSNVTKATITYNLDNDDKNIVSVSSQGKVKGLKSGEADIEIKAVYKVGKRTYTNTTKVTITVEKPVVGKTYNHFGIAINLVDDDGKLDGYYLTSKPTIVANGGRYKDTSVPLVREYANGKNGKEYQSNGGYYFNSNTVFTIKATFTNGNQTIQSEFEITDIDNYKGSGKSFYEYCAYNYCNDGRGIDIKLTYTELVENFYDVIYIVDGKISEDITDGNNYKEGDKVTVSNEVPAMEGNKFVGWEYNNNIYEANKEVTMGNEQIQFVAKFEKTYSVSYQVDDKVTGDGILYVTNDKATVQGAPEKPGYEFDYWSYNDGQYKENDVLTIKDEDILLVAHFTKIHTVEYVVNGKTVSSENVKDGNDAVFTPSYNDSENLLEEGTEFVYWMIDGIEATTDDLKNIKEDIILVAKTQVKEFTVTYLVDGNPVDTINNVEYGTKYVVKEDYVKEGYDFSGWSTPSGAEIKITNNIVITGTTSIKEFTVTYVVDGKIVDTIENIEYGTKYVVKEDYVEEGYNFSGWSIQSGTELEITNNVVIEGTKSLKEFTVTFYEEDGKTIISQLKYNYGQPGMRPSYPANYNIDIIDENGDAVRVQYSFDKWQTLGDYGLSNLDSIKENMEFKATFKSKNVPVTYYVLNRGLSQPNEINSYPADNYSKGLAGGIKAFVDEGNDDLVYANLGTRPTEENFNNEYNLGIDTSKEYIKWYVIKEQSNGWHVDGIITAKPEVIINYVNEDGETVSQSYSKFYDANSEYEVVSPDVAGYSLENVDDAKISGTTGKTGQTVINVVYTKNSYELTVNYVYENGEAVKNDNGEALVYTETVKHGESYNVVTEVIEGYTVDKEVVAGTMPIGNVTETVTFTKIKFNVTYFLNGIVYEKDTVEYGADYDINKVEYEPAFGHNFTGWFTENEVKNVKSDIKIYGTTSELIIPVTINYIDEDGSIVEDAYQTAVAFGKSYSQASPTVEGYELAVPEESIISGKIKTEDAVVINVVYTKNSYKLTVNYVYENGETVKDEDGNSLVYTETVKYKDSYNVETNSIEGYTFDKVAVTGTMPASDVTETVVYTKNSYKLTVNYVYDNDETVKDEDGNSLVYTETVKYKDSYNVETNSIEGYTFDKVAVTGTMPASDVTETVVYTKIKYNVTYFLNGIVYEEDIVEYGTDYDIDKVEYEPAYGHNFTGWSTENEVKNVKSDIKIYGTTSELIIPVTINYIDEDGNIVEDSYQTAVVFGESYSQASPTVEGYELAVLEEAIISGEIKTEDAVVINVVYNKLKFVITYIVDGEEYETVEVEYGEITNINDVEYTPEEGYQFSGWTIEGNVDITDGVKQNITIVGTTAEIIEIIDDNDPLDDGDKNNDKDGNKNNDEETIEIEGEDNPLDGPKTGDNENIVMYVSIMSLAAVLALGIFGIRKKENSEK